MNERPIAVLLVEDNPGDARLLREELADAAGDEFRVTHVGRLSDALRSVGEARYDVILLDLSLPDSEPSETVRRLHDGEPGAPIVVLTGTKDEASGIEAVRQGAQDYLVKGETDRRLLIRAIRYAIERHRGEQERERLLEAARAAVLEAAQANRAKDDFLAVLSHELRTPLTPILLAASLLESRRDLPPEVGDDIQAIRREVQIEAKLIDDLLDLTRVARGKIQFDFQLVNLHLLVRSAADACCRGEGPKVVFELGAARDHVRADRARIEQVFRNLLGNAWKFTGTDGTITIRSANAGVDRIRVEVADTGAGIEPDFMPRLFDAFQQGRGGAVHGGLGLGLAISKAIVNAHGGEIRAASAGAGRGATFSVELPLTPVDRPVIARDLPAAELPIGRRKLRVLVVEDDLPSLDMIRRLVKLLGHDVQTATGVGAALEAAARNEFDLVISDLGLPDGNGHDLMRQMRDRYRVKGIALSGYGMEHDIRRSRDAGFAEHLTKPVDAQALGAAIDRVGCAKGAEAH